MSSFAPQTLASAEQLQAIDGLIGAAKLQEAAAALNVLTSKAPADPRPYLLGMRLAEASGNPKGALDAAQRAVRLAPDWSVTVTELALLLARQNRFQEAVEQARKAVALEPNSQQVLTRVIDVAHRAQNFGQALEWLRMLASQVPPDAPGLPEVRRLIARDLHLLGQHAESVAAWGELIAADATDAQSLLGRLQACLAAGDRAQAVADGKALVALLPGQEVPAFWLELAQGKTPARMPEAMVRDQYDAQAGMYDALRTHQLNYQLPLQVARRIVELYPSRELNLLDLGCGTGLLGLCLGKVKGAIIGVDLSTAMVQQAMRHRVYDRFHTVNLLDALQETPANLYDVITALDVLLYVGDLGSSVPNALRVLRPGGHFIFSCEAAAEGEPDVVLRPGSLSYAHRREAVEALCRQAGFDDIRVEDIDLRTENGTPVKGFLVVARKPA